MTAKTRFAFSIFILFRKHREFYFGRDTPKFVLTAHFDFLAGFNNDIMELGSFRVRQTVRRGRLTVLFAYQWSTSFWLALRRLQVSCNKFFC